MLRIVFIPLCLIPLDFTTIRGSTVSPHVTEGETEAPPGGHSCAGSWSICVGASCRIWVSLFLILLHLPALRVRGGARAESQVGSVHEAVKRAGEAHVLRLRPTSPAPGHISESLHPGPPGLALHLPRGNAARPLKLGSREGILLSLLKTRRLLRIGSSG